MTRRRGVSFALFKRAAIAVLALTLLAGPAAASGEEDDDRDDGPSALHRVVTYLPCRVLDLMDVFRLRARVGPGVAVGVRATEAADFFAGTYLSLYAGLPGPRGRPAPRLPIGIESLTGVEVSVADLTTGAGLGPDYSTTEFGMSLQVLLVGVDAGFDPVELADFVTGLFLIDLRDDDF